MQERTRTCSLDWCDQPCKVRGYCIKHMAQIRTKGAIVDQSDWVCGWCGASISHLSTRAGYCSPQHKKNAASRRHRARNPGYYTRYSRSEARLAYREANREVLRRTSRERRYTWDEARQAEEREKARAWWAANSQRHLEYNARKRARERNAQGSVGVSERDWLRLVRRYEYRCAYCGVTPPKLHKDHVIPIHRGGRHAIGNILPCCRSCNSSKCARLLSDWRYRR